jgi:chemotaxis protein methyltransferase CheR
MVEYSARSLVLSDLQFAKVRQLIREYAGIAMAPTKLQMASNRLGRHLKLLQISDFDSYLNAVRTDLTARQGFIDCLTTNVTAFFREVHHFHVLSHHLTKLKAQGRTATQFRGWSAGCSSGEEPISILMTLLDAFGTLPSSSLAIGSPLLLASDIDSATLAKARQARYSAEAMSAVPGEKRFRYFDALADGSFQLKSSFSSLMQYEHLNLNSASLNLPHQFAGGLDFIFCRNVMIYFPAEVQRQLLLKFNKLLKPEGLLFVGHSEMLLHSDDLFESLGRTVFRVRKW